MEAGGQSGSKVATLVLDILSVHGLQWLGADVEEALNGTIVTLHGVQPFPVEPEGAVLGPTLTTTLLVQGTLAEILLDTDSLVTIMSRAFLVKAIARSKNSKEAAIREEVKSPVP